MKNCEKNRIKNNLRSGYEKTIIFESVSHDCAFAFGYIYKCICTQDSDNHYGSYVNVYDF